MGSADAPHRASRRAAADPNRLAMRLTPSTAAQVAEGSVAFVAQKFGFTLPYTPESLILVDALIDKIRATGATEQQALGLLSGLGCYVGEVLVRNARASWRWTAEMGMSEPCRVPIVLAWPGPRACDPIGRVLQRFSGAAVDGVAQLYEAAVPPPERNGAGSRRP
jgi:hypothetical protein